jgi:hypothetical protein
VEKDNTKTILSMLDGEQIYDLLCKTISSGEFEAAKEVLKSPRAEINWHMLKLCCEHMDKTKENIRNICELVMSNEVVGGEDAVFKFFELDKLSSAAGKLYLLLLEKKIGKEKIKSEAIDWVKIRLGGILNLLSGAGHTSIENKYANKLTFIIKMLDDKDKVGLLRNNFFSVSILFESMEVNDVKTRDKSSLRELMWPIFFNHCKDFGLGNLENLRRSCPLLLLRLENEIIKESTRAIDMKISKRKTI